MVSIGAELLIDSTVFLAYYQHITTADFVVLPKA
jgi:hypothetical protein